MGLEPEHLSNSSIVESAVISAQSTCLGGGEGEAHRALKNYVAEHPELVQLGAAFPKGGTEVALPSGDKLDVSFRKTDSVGNKLWVAVEVKSSISTIGDIARGIFQCVKYKAVMDAVVAFERKNQEIRVVLLLEGKLPNALLKLKEKLGIEVIDGISPTGTSRR